MPNQHLRIERSMGPVTARAVTRLHRGVFKYEWSFHFSMTIHTSISWPHCTPQHRIATFIHMRIVAVDTLHPAFQNWMVKRLPKIGTSGLMALYTELS